MDGIFPPSQGDYKILPIGIDINISIISEHQEEAKILTISPKTYLPVPSPRVCNMCVRTLNDIHRTMI